MFFLLKLTYHIYDLVQRDTKHYCYVVLNRKDWSTGLAVSKQVLSQFLVVIAIYRKDILEQILYIYGNYGKSKIQILSVKNPVLLNFLLLKRDLRVQYSCSWAGVGGGAGGGGGNLNKTMHGFHPYCFRD